MTSIVTMDMAFDAHHLALPTIRELCKRHTWGPPGVAVAVLWKASDGFSILQFLGHMEELGTDARMKETYGYNFRQIALEKAQLSLREGRPTSEIQASRPWALQEGDTLFGGGVAEDTNLAVGVSGLYDQIDEVIAWIIWNIIVGECAMRLKKDREDEKRTRLGEEILN